jgi:hypothetical protein
MSRFSFELTSAHLADRIDSQHVVPPWEPSEPVSQMGPTDGERRALLAAWPTTVSVFLSPHCAYLARRCNDRDR